MIALMPLPDGRNSKRPAVAGVAQAGHRGPTEQQRAARGGVDAQRRGGREEGLRAVADQQARAAADDVVRLRRIEGLRADARRAGERVLALPALQQDADLGVVRELRELRARVVAREDRLVADALQREAVGAVLAHADAVPEAGAADHEPRGGMGRRGAGEDEQADEETDLAHST